MCDDWARSGWYVKQTASSSGIRCCANCKNYTLARECDKIKVSMKNHSIMGGNIFDSKAWFALLKYKSRSIFLGGNFSCLTVIDVIYSSSI